MSFCMDCTAELTQKPFITPHKETNNFCFTADHKQIEQRHPDHILGPRGGHGGLERRNHTPGDNIPDILSGSVNRKVAV